MAVCFNSNYQEENNKELEIAVDNLKEAILKANLPITLKVHVILAHSS